MFDLPACPGRFYQLPLSFRWSDFEWLAIPLLIFLVLAFLALRWLIQNQELRRRLSNKKGIFFLGITVASLLLIFSFADKGLVLFLPADSGEKVDAIVVLGRGQKLGRLRVDVTAQLWQAQRAPVIFSSGKGDTPRMMRQLEEKGIPTEVIDGENCSLTTTENAIFSAAILHQRGIKNILLITDAPHIWRSVWEFQDWGFNVIPYTSPLHKMTFTDKTFLIFREYFFLISSGIKRLLPGNSADVLDNPELRQLVEKAEQYGRRVDFDVNR